MSALAICRMIIRFITDDGSTGGYHISLKQDPSQPTLTGFGFTGWNLAYTNRRFRYCANQFLPRANDIDD